MVAMGDSARIDRLEDAVDKINEDIVKLAAGALNFTETAQKNDALVIEYISNLTPWLEACRVLLVDIRKRLDEIERRAF